MQRRVQYSTYVSYVAPITYRGNWSASSFAAVDRAQTRVDVMPYTRDVSYLNRLIKIMQIIIDVNRLNNSSRGYVTARTYTQI